MDVSEKGFGAILYQIQNDGTTRVIAYASRNPSKPEKNYNANKLEFLALKWAITNRIHEYLHGGNFEVFTDNSSLTYLLTTVKLDATGQGWMASLTNYNFKLHYKSGKLNVEVDPLSRIPWEQEEVLHTLDTIAVKAIISRTYNGERSIPEIPPDTISVIAKGLVVNSTTKLSRQDWKMEQQAGSDIGPIITSINNKALLQYVAKEGILLE